MEVSKRIVNALNDIHARRKKLTPEIVVSEAKNPRHPLHRDFEWNNARAAHKHRLEQAAFLIRHVKVTLITEDGPVNVRRWHAVKAAGVIDAPDGYLPNEEVHNNADYRQALMRQMRIDVDRLVAKYEHLKEFWTLLRKTKPQRKKRSA